MRNKVVQISLFDTYTDVLQTMEEEKSEFLSLMEKYIDFGAVIPPQFHLAYLSFTGRKRIYQLESFVRALILQRRLACRTFPSFGHC